MLLAIQKNTTPEDTLWGEDVTDEAEARAALRAAGFREDVMMKWARTDEGEGWEVDLTWEELAERCTYAHPSAVAIELGEQRMAIWAPTY